MLEILMVVPLASLMVVMKVDLMVVMKVDLRAPLMDVKMVENLVAS